MAVFGFAPTEARYVSNPLNNPGTDGTFPNFLKLGNVPPVPAFTAISWLTVGCDWGV